MKIAERLDVVLERHLPARTGTAFRVDAGDCILLRAEMPAVIGVSACPQDITLTCGQRPTDLQIQVLR
jgi:uncharacterized protein YcgI (DUF1989 family)